MTQPLHGTVVALRVSGQWRGVLIRGQSGAGKSDLALRLMAMGAQLVVDDQALIWHSGGHVFAGPPPRISGIMEVRGPGITPVRHLNLCRLWLMVDLVQETPERFQFQNVIELQGTQIAHLELNSQAASAPLVIACALESL